MWKSQVKRFLGLRGNRQLVLAVSVLASSLAIGGSYKSFAEARSSRLHAEEHALEIETLQQTKTELAQQEIKIQDLVAEQRRHFVTVEAADEFRDQIIALVRESKCRLRSIHPGDQDIRRWMEGDSVLSLSDMFNAQGEEIARTPYELVSQSLNLQVFGTFEDTQLLLQKVQQLNKAFVTRALSMQVVPEEGIQLDWDLQYFDLHPVIVKGDEW